MTTRLCLASALLALTLAPACKKAPPEAAPAPVPVAAAPEPEPENPVTAAVRTMKENFQRVHFETDKADLDAETKAALDANVDIMQSHPTIQVEIQGHADERGTTDYNIALGDRRANAVREYMATTGIAGSRLTTISYGEEIPAATGSDEQAWSQNRRAEFKIVVGEAMIEGTTE